MRSAAYLIVFLALLSSAFCSERNTLRLETILYENFDTGQIPTCFIGKLKISEAPQTACKAISKNVLIAKGAPKSWKYPRALRIALNNVQMHDVIDISFHAASMETNNAKNFALLLGIKNGKEIRFQEKIFSRSSTPQNIRFAGYIRDNCDSYYLDITGEGPFTIAIDNINIKRASLPKESSWIFEKEAILGIRFQPTDGYFLDLTQPFLTMSKDEFFPFIDKYGQFKHKRWENKIYKDEDFKDRILQEEAFNSSLKDIANRDKYGGLISKRYKYKATGRFRTEKVGDSWFLVDPLGNLFWSIGIDCVGMDSLTGITNRENYFEDISNSRYIVKDITYGKFFYEKIKFSAYNFSGSNLEKKYGIGYKYEDIAVPRMKKWGINTYGAWTDGRLLRAENMPYAYIINSFQAKTLDAKMPLFGYWQPLRDFFSEEFETKTIQILDSKRDIVSSQWCVGVFVDNELPWQNEPLKTAKAVLTCPKDQPAKLALKKLLENKYKSVEMLNKVWESSYSDWENFLEERDFVPKTKASENDLSLFEQSFYDRYFEVCRRAVKNAGKDVLYFGCRLAWCNDDVAISASKYCDVVSYNLYKDDVYGFDLPAGAQDKPVIIGEFHFGDASGGVFGGGLVPRATVESKADSFIKYMLSAVKNPRIVGAHWFQWFDECTSGRFDGENYAIGFVDIADTPHYPMAKAAHKFSNGVYKLRLNRYEKKCPKVKLVQQKEPILH